VALVHDGSPDGKAMAARVVYILSLNDDGRKASIASAGGIEALVALARDGLPDGKYAAAAVLRQMLVALVYDGTQDGGRAAAAAALRNLGAYDDDRKK